MRLSVDESLTGCVMPCPLCHQRFLETTPIAAWKALYHHLRYHHDELHAGQLTQQVRLRIARLNWENRQKESG